MLTSLFCLYILFDPYYLGQFILTRILLLEKFRCSPSRRSPGLLVLASVSHSRLSPGLLVLASVSPSRHSPGLLVLTSVSPSRRSPGLLVLASA